VPHNAVAVGDAENDHDFLTAVACGVAVGDAVEALRERADQSDGGARARGCPEDDRDAAHR
jgi:hydroxymethylpyrimidine pyrophosphatase-like HAD family hydrolase